VFDQFHYYARFCQFKIAIIWATPDFSAKLRQKVVIIAFFGDYLRRLVIFLLILHSLWYNYSIKHYKNAKCN